MVTQTQPSQPEPTQTVQHVEALPVEVNALELMERATVDVQIATAHRYPRSITKFRDKAIEMVKADVETAESCVYRRPVGKEGGKQIYAEGESIRLAEIVGATYGNLRASGIISEVTPRFVKAVGFAHDLESNYAAKSEVMEATVTKDGKPFSERMRVVFAKAAVSKAIRDAIFRVVPKSLCKPIINEARKIIAGTERPLVERRKMVSDWLKKLAIDSARVFAVLGVNGIDELGDSELEELQGIRTALKEGDVTLDEAFPEIQAGENGNGGKNTLKDRIAGTASQPQPISETVPQTVTNAAPKPEEKQAADNEASRRAELLDILRKGAAIHYYITRNDKGDPEVVEDQGGMPVNELIENSLLALTTFKSTKDKNADGSAKWVSGIGEISKLSGKRLEIALRTARQIDAETEKEVAEDAKVDEFPY